MLITGLTDTSVYAQWWTHKPIMDLSNSIVHVTYNLDDFLWVPHGVLELSSLASLTLLAIQLKHHAAGVGRIVQVKPEHHSTLHRSPSMSALLTGESDFGTVLERPPAI